MSGAADEPGSPVVARVAWYASSSPGSWRDWLTLLHPPYTAWHLGYVLVGAGLAPVLSVERLLATLLAFALAVGVASHGFDELKGRPLGTVIATPLLYGVSATALAGAVLLGVLGIRWVGWGLAGFIAVGAVLVVAYNLELWEGRLHNDTVFALAWGSFPLLTAYYAQETAIRPAAIAGALFAFGLSRAQRLLSNEARDLRRRVAQLTGATIYRDGTQRSLTRAAVLRPIERALVSLSWCTCALGIGLVLVHTGW